MALSIASTPASRLPPPPDFDGAVVADTLMDCAAEPPGPLQVKVKVSEALTTIAELPLIGSPPVQPVPPLAVQAEIGRAHV